MKHISEIDQNLDGDADPDLIRFTGAAFGMAADKRMGIVMQTCKYGQYLDGNLNTIFRENCGENPNLGELNQKYS